MNLINIYDMLVPGIPILEKILRPVIVYAFLVIGLRIAGKREMAQLNPFDFVVLLTISNTVQNAIIGNDNSITGGLLGASALLIANHLSVRFIFKHRRAEKIIEGGTDVLINNGKINHTNLKKELITLSELRMAAHKQGFSSLDDIEKAIIEPDGVISFIPVKPGAEEIHYREMLKRLTRIENRIAALKNAAE